MLPTINGKPLLECNKEDFEEILGNPNYIENEYLDYKQEFSVLNYSKEQNNEKKQKINEFLTDVCSFANTEGGYLIYGVAQDDEGIPARIKGIEINNRDNFILSLKDYLSRIMPRIPCYKTQLIELGENKYILILLIMHDYFAPYVHIIDNKNYIIYRRIGNSNSIMTYSEMKKMFNQSITIEKEIDFYRKERTVSFQDDSKQFVVFHIIPEYFLDDSIKKKTYLLYREDDQINNLLCILHNYEKAFPMADGIRAFNDKGQQVRLYNNFVAEFYSPIEIYRRIHEEEFFIPYDVLWVDIKKFLSQYINGISKYISDQRIYVCLSLIGCKGFLTDISTYKEMYSKVDRNDCYTEPIIIESMKDNDLINKQEKLFRLEYLFALGVRNNEELSDLIKEVNS